MKIQNYNPSRMINNFKDIRENIDKKYHDIVNLILDELTAKSEYQLIRIKQTKSILIEKIVTAVRFQKNIIGEMNQKMANLINQQINLCKTLTNELLLSNPLEILKKGYSIIRDSEGKIVKSKCDLDKIQSFSAEFKDGVAKIKKPVSIK
jgi:exodeoxyribonuclease VII large subunit